MVVEEYVRKFVKSRVRRGSANLVQTPHKWSICLLTGHENGFVENSSVNDQKHFNATNDDVWGSVPPSPAKDWQVSKFGTSEDWSREMLRVR